MTNDFWQGLLVGFLFATVAVSCVWLLLSEWWEAQHVVPVVQGADWDDGDWANDDLFDDPIELDVDGRWVDDTPEDQEALLKWQGSHQ